MRKALLNSVRAILIILVIAIAALLYYLQPMTATQIALSALKSSSGVKISTTSEVIAFEPTSIATRGYIFYPGALVDPRAYAYYMHTFAEHGIATYIVKMPFDFALIDENYAEKIITQHPTIQKWIIGGHSLGGVAACTFAATHNHQINGVVLYGSYPATNIAHQLAHIPVLSLSGSNDGLATPAKINQNKSLLPTDTNYVVIQGSIHSYFGEYGNQAGDGNPTISRENARQQITNQTLAFLQKI